MKILITRRCSMPRNRLAVNRYATKNGNHRNLIKIVINPIDRIGKQFVCCYENNNPNPYEHGETTYYYSSTNI